MKQNKSGAMASENRRLKDEMIGKRSGYYWRRMEGLQRKELLEQMTSRQ